MGLRQEIANAKSESEALKLLEKGVKHFTVASEKTKRAWKSTTKRVIESLSKPKTSAEVKDKDSKKSSPKKKSKK